MTWTKQRLNDLFFIIGVVAVVVMMLTFDVSFIELWAHPNPWRLDYHIWHQRPCMERSDAWSHA